MNSKKSGTVNEMANCVVKNKALVHQLEQLGFVSKNPDGMTFKEVMICSQIANAAKGDLDSYRAIMDYKDQDLSGSPLESYLNGNTILSGEVNVDIE